MKKMGATLLHTRPLVTSQVSFTSLESSKVQALIFFKLSLTYAHLVCTALECRSAPHAPTHLFYEECQLDVYNNAQRTALLPTVLKLF